MTRTSNRRTVQSRPERILGPMILPLSEPARPCERRLFARDGLHFTPSVPRSCAAHSVTTPPPFPHTAAMSDDSASDVSAPEVRHARLRNPPLQRMVRSERNDDPIAAHRHGLTPGPGALFAEILAANLSRDLHVVV